MKYSFDPFVIEYPFLNTPIRSFKEECINAAYKVIEQNYRKLPLIILMSGGIDSEVIAEIFLAANIPFKCLIGRLQIRTPNGVIDLNSHDFRYAEDWCLKNNKEIIYCDLDIYKKADLLIEYALYSKGFSPQYAWHMYLMKNANEMGYYFVGGVGDIDIVLKDDNYYSVDFQREYSIDIFYEKYSLDGVIRFWKIDPRQVASFLELSSVVRLMNNRKEHLVDYKYEYYSEVFPHIKNRTKFTGFENIQEWDSLLRTYMKQFNKQYDNISYTPISYFTKGKLC